MKAILALGNPGERYRDTRHNAGWWLADRLRAAWSFPPFRHDGISAWTHGHQGGEAVRIVKPLTYVNRSGQVLAPLLDQEGFRPSEDLLVLVDDVALSPGQFRLRARGSAGGHNGLISVEETLGSQEYGRARIGVGRPPRSDIDLAAWVLAPLPPAEEEAVLARFDELTRAVECWVEEGMVTAMNRFNRTDQGTGG